MTNETRSDTAHAFTRTEGGETGEFLRLTYVPADEPIPGDGNASGWFWGLSPVSRRVALRAAGIDPDGKRQGYPRDGADHDAAFLAVYGVGYPTTPGEPPEDPTPHRGRADYGERVDARRDRLENAAERAQADSDGAANAAHAATAGIPFGQPILVGHHSEGRHRRAVERSHANTRKAIDRSNDAARLRGRAASVGRAGVSSDDPEAVTKLRAKLEGLEASRAMMKRGNAAWRAARKNPAVLDDDGKFGDLPARTREMLRGWTPPYSFVKAPFGLTNIGASVRSVKARIAALEEAAAEAPREAVTGADAPAFAEDREAGENPWRVFEDREANRVCLEFGRRISRDRCRDMRTWGLRWNPTLGAWTRLLNAGGWSAAVWAAYGGRCAHGAVSDGAERCHVRANGSRDGLPTCGNHDDDREAAARRAVGLGGAS